MNTTGRLVTILIALTFFGCKGPLQTSAASTGEGASGASSGEGASTAPASGGGTRVAQITDPTLNNMTAVSVTIPTNWKFQGVLLEGTGTACSTVPSAVWRATSADGLSRAEVLPPLTWAYGTGPKVGDAQKDGACLPLNRAMTAQEVLKFLARTMRFQYVADMPVPAEMNDRAQEGLRAGQAKALASRPGYNLALPKATVELARAAVSYKNGAVPMKGRMMTWVNCTETAFAGATTFPGWNGRGPVPGLVKGAPSTLDKCTASVVLIAGPDSQYAGLIREWDTPGMGQKGYDDAWADAWVKRGWQRNDAMIGAAEARTNMLLQQTRHTMAVQKQMSDQFIQSIQQQGADAREQTQENMNARSTSASDMVDYALDQKTVMNTDTGQIYRISNQSTALGPEVQVHGNGQPY